MQQRQQHLAPVTFPPPHASRHFSGLDVGRAIRASAATQRGAATDIPRFDTEKIDIKIFGFVLVRELF